MDQKAVLELLLTKLIIVINKYKWLIDLYVLDFFVDNHWDALPLSWQKSLEDIDPSEIGKLISGQRSRHVFPLSLLSLVQTVKALSVPRQPAEGSSTDIHNVQDKDQIRLNNLLFKHVKLKKRHEISVIAEVVSEISSKTGCSAVVDFGSGLGHLVRVLSYKYGLHTAGVEGQSQFTEEARKLDLELECNLKKKSSHNQTQHHRPTHLNITLTSTNLLPLPNHFQHYGLVGLHPCGDLGPLLLRHFVNNDRVRFVCIVGCCYMKLSGEGYPMSQFVGGLEGHELSYAGREIACHAIEMYTDRLVAGNYHDLKVHAYRAALERVLVAQDASLRHAQVRSVKHAHSMTFQTYCELALHKLSTSIDRTSPTWHAALQDVRRWRRAVSLYSLRLLLAPLVEGVVLLDRLLHVRELGLHCEILPVFDPKISPRNHIIIGRKI